jgi:hypothetical protein
MKKLLLRLKNLLHKEQQTVENNQEFMYTEEQLMARLRFFIGVCLALTLTGIVFVVLYSIIFVTQPLNAISPIDQKFFELIIPIATFLTGTLSGIMLAGNDKDAKMKALDMASGVNKPTPLSPTPSPMMTRPAMPPSPMPMTMNPTPMAYPDPIEPVMVPPSVAVPPRVAVPPIIKKPGE